MARSPSPADEHHYTHLNALYVKLQGKYILVWNKLSTDCVHATSVNVFKNRIDKYLVKAGYTKNKGRLHVGIV